MEEVREHVTIGAFPLTAKRPPDLSGQLHRVGDPRPLQLPLRRLQRAHSWGHPGKGRPPTSGRPQRLLVGWTPGHSNGPPKFSQAPDTSGGGWWPRASSIITSKPTLTRPSDLRHFTSRPAVREGPGSQPPKPGAAHAEVPALVAEVVASSSCGSSCPSPPCFASPGRSLSDRPSHSFSYIHRFPATCS